MVEYYGNCSSLFDWDKIILDIADQTPAYIGPKHKPSDDIPGLDEVADLWKYAGYKPKAEGGVVAWDMFFAEQNFDQSIVDKLAEYCKLDKVQAAWISRIWPGYFAPQHWDVNDNEVELNLQPPKVRFHCHMSKPAFGHVFIAGEQCFYNQAQGSVYKWSDRKLWHAGTNCGLVPKYIFNIW